MGTIDTLRRKAPGGGCPICGKAVSPRFRPFCSARCTHIDLARWLDGSYSIPGEPAETPPATDAPEKDET